MKDWDQRGMLSGTLLVRRGAEESVWGVGFANDDTETRNSADSIYLIASISKGFVSAAILKLLDEGALNLQDTLHRWIPEYPEKNLRSTDGREVTLETLLHCTPAEFRRRMRSREIDRKLDRVPVSFSEIVASIRNKPLKFAPGTQYEYSNTGYVLLGEVVRRASGMAYHEYLQKRFFQPMHLDSTSVAFPYQQKNRVARSYETKTREDVIEKYGLLPIADADVFADTNIYTDVSDLAHWGEAVTSGEVLSGESTKIMLTPGLNEYGCGWGIHQDGAKRTIYEHAGYYRSFETHLRRYPNEKITLVWLSNQPMEDDKVFDFIEAVATAVLAPQ